MENIQSKEFREGNLVILYGQIATIQRNDFGGSGIAIDKGKPIPLTEDWLIKSGAIARIKKIMTFDRFRLIYKPDYRYWYIMDRISLTYMTKIKYVHEWQNFIFVMNGVELTIK